MVTCHREKNLRFICDFEVSKTEVFGNIDRISVQETKVYVRHTVALFCT